MHQVFLILILALGMTACSAGRPNYLGLFDGRFVACPESPNCISSFAAVDDAEHYFPPWATSDDPQQDWQQLLQLIKAESRLSIIEHDGAYLYVEARTPIMRYVDDLQWYLDEKQRRIYVYSASRLGYSDLGKNRSRMERLKSLWQARKQSVFAL